MERGTNRASGSRSSQQGESSLQSHLVPFLTEFPDYQPRTEEEQRRAAKRLLKRQKERKRKLAEAGIKYNLEAVGYVSMLASVTVDCC